MPRSAIMTGAWTSCSRWRRFRKPSSNTAGRWRSIARTRERHRASGTDRIWLAEIIDLLRTKTAHDFTLYKPGTLQRRIERRMAHGGDRDR